MKRSKILVGACSAALMAGWSGAGLAQQQQGSQQQDPRMQSQQTQQTQKQQTRNTQAQADRQKAHGSKAVIESAGQPTNVLLFGKVTDARDVTLAGTAGDKHRLLKVQPKGGQEVVVDVGVPQNTSGMSFSKGDRIVAMGKPARINGRPVLFAADVAEMQRVNVSSDKQGQAGQQTARQQQSGQQSAQGSAQQQTASRSGTTDAVIYLFETDNFAEDDYGAYDEDFAWTTEDSTYDTWNDTATAWENTEQAHYDMFGYDDRGEQGLWDW